MNSWLERMIASNNSEVTSGRYFDKPEWIPDKMLRQTQLDPKKRLDVDPVTLGGVIAFNETYMDVADWAYQKLGPFDIIWMFMMLGPLYFGGLIGWRNFISDPPGPDKFWVAFFACTFVCILSSLFVLWSGRVLFKTCTGYTHYPVRLDRRNQMVHVFRHNGEGGVLSLPWKDLTFGIGHGELKQGPTLVVGYVKRDDGHYDYFRLGMTWTTMEGHYQQWEYYRRYMEEGPDALPEPELLLPIDGKRESFRVGAQLSWFVAGPYLYAAVLFCMLSVPGSLLRWAIMRVRRLPRWPQHVIDSCPVSPDDRYAFKPAESLDVSIGLATVVTLGVLALDAAFVWWFIGILVHRN